MLKKDYCDYETCVALERLGFNDSTDLRYNHSQILGDFLGGVKAPTLYEAQKWLREEKHLHIEIRWFSNLWYEYEVNEAEGKILAEGSAFKTYEEALSTAIYMATEHLKEEEK